MNSDVLKKRVKNVSIFMAICLLLPLFYGAPVQAHSLSDPTIAFLSHPLSNKIDSGNSAFEFDTPAGHDSIIFSSTSNTVDISAKVYVKSYTRKSGVKVQSHYRRDPR